MIDTKAVRALADQRPWLEQSEMLRQCADEIDTKDAIINSQREALERTWFVLKDFGAHPGRTDDLLHDCVRRAFDTLRELVREVLEYKVKSWEKWCERAEKALQKEGPEGP